MRSILVATALLASSTACQSFLPTVHGSGLVMTEVREAVGFHAIKVSGNARVLLTQGNQESLDIECDDNLLPHILTSVNDGVLHVRFERGSWSPSERPTYRIGVRELDSVRLGGSTRLEANALHGDELELHLSGSGTAELESLTAARASLRTSGSGEFHIGQIDVEDVEIDISGSGEVEVMAGKAGRVDIATSGSGDLDLKGVEARKATLRISGSGTAQIWVRDELEARVSGSGAIGYLGAPSVHSSVSGSGEVYPLRDGAK
jgi:hypothetical protein